MLKRTFPIALALITSFISCSSQQPIESEITNNTTSYTLKAGYIRSGEERKLSVEDLSPNLKHTEFRWFTEKGEILKQEGHTITFKAPDSPGILNVNCQRIFRNRIQEITHFELVVYKQVVVLKADDLVYASHSIFPHNWNLYFGLLDSMGIKGSAGIIGKSLEDAPQAYCDKIKKLNQKGIVEFWNHGYSHSLNIKNAQGEACHEYKNSGYAFQEAQMKRSQQLAKEKLGFPFRAFGAPGNAIDEHTALLVEQNDDIKVWFYGMPGAEKSILNRSTRSEMEFPTHKPDFNKFIAHYDAEAPYLALQFHPTSWNSNHFKDFKKMLFYLKEKDVVFMKPTEFARAFYPALVNDIPEVEILL